MKKIFSATRFLPLIFFATAIAQCADRTEAAPPADDAIAIKTQPVSVVAYAPELSYAGSIASTAEARLSFKVGGVISRIYVKEGDAVGKGQLLATLNLTEIDAQVQQAMQNAEKARRDAKRIQNLYRDTVATLEQFQNANTQLQVAEEGLRIAQFNRQYAQIRATENGTILRKLMNEGEMASAGAPVFFFSGTAGNGWVIRFGVADKDWAVLKKGDRATVTLDAYPTTTFSGAITEIAQGADPASGTYEVEVSVNPAGHRFASGLFGRVQLHPGNKQTVTMVPIEAIAEADQRAGFVYTLNQDQRTVTKHTVTIAFLEKDKAAIARGLEGVQEVITDGVGFLTERSVVKLVK